jgi:dTDP-4-amino-4,6-dideoxy-D-galactose acyltransferase
MLVTEPERYPGTCEILEWDSTFFGCRIARFRGARCTPDDAVAIVTECAAGAIDCVYILVTASDTESLATVQRTRAYLADIRVTFGAETGEISSEDSIPDTAVRVRVADGSDIPALRQIATFSHLDTRFYADRHFAAERCDQLYQLWIEKSCQGYADAVFVAEDNGGQPAGYVTCHRGGAQPGRIGLFAVREDMRGRGVGRGLLRAALRWFAANGAASMTVATQLRNLRALQFYGRAGLVIVAVELWFHLWPRDVHA